MADSTASPPGSADASVGRSEPLRNLVLASLDFGRESLEAVGHLRTFEPGEPFSLAGDESGVLFPETCVATVFVVMRDGTSAEVSSIGREGLVGFAYGVPNVANLSITIDIPGTGLMVGRAGMERLLGIAAFRQNVLRHFEHQALLTARLAACNRLHHLHQRLARWILLNSDRVGRESFPMTQERLAAIMGVRRPAVTIAASDLMRRELIHYVRGNMVVTDREGLRAESCECYDDIRTIFRLR